MASSDYEEWRAVGKRLDAIADGRAVVEVDGLTAGAGDVNGDWFSAARQAHSLKRAANPQSGASGMAVRRRPAYFTNVS
jgi:hypothetical protein